MLWAVESPWNSDSNGNDEGADKAAGKGGDEGVADGGEAARDGGQSQEQNPGINASACGCKSMASRNVPGVSECQGAENEVRVDLCREHLKDQ